VSTQTTHVTTGMATSNRWVQRVTITLEMNYPAETVGEQTEAALRALEDAYKEMKTVLMVTRRRDA
jgi:hypothetical protein